MLQLDKCFVRNKWHFKLCNNGVKIGISYLKHVHFKNTKHSTLQQVTKHFDMLQNVVNVVTFTNLLITLQQFQKSMWSFSIEEGNHNLIGGAVAILWLAVKFEVGAFAFLFGLHNIYHNGLQRNNRLNNVFSLFSICRAILM